MPIQNTGKSITLKNSIEQGLNTAQKSNYDHAFSRDYVEEVTYELEFQLLSPKFRDTMFKK